MATDSEIEVQCSQLKSFYCFTQILFTLDSVDFCLFCLKTSDTDSSFSNNCRIFIIVVIVVLDFSSFTDASSYNCCRYQSSWEEASRCPEFLLSSVGKYYENTCLYNNHGAAWYNGNTLSWRSLARAGCNSNSAGRWICRQVSVSSAAAIFL